MLSRPVEPQPVKKAYRHLRETTKCVLNRLCAAGLDKLCVFAQDVGIDVEQELKRGRGRLLGDVAQFGSDRDARIRWLSLQV